MIKLSVNETQWSSLLARTRALILCISIGIFDFGPEKLPGLSKNGPQGALITMFCTLNVPIVCTDPVPFPSLCQRKTGEISVAF